MNEENEFYRVKSKQLINCRLSKIKEATSKFEILLRIFKFWTIQKFSDSPTNLNKISENNYEIFHKNMNSS